MAVPDLPPKSGSSSTGARSAMDISLYSPDELLELRSRIDELLPVRRLKDLNLETELVLQLQTVQRLQSEVLKDENIPANQIAQVAGTVANALATLSKLQIEVHNSERLKQIEATLITMMGTLPKLQQKQFLEEYEAKLGKAGG